MLPKLASGTGATKEYTWWKVDFMHRSCPSESITLVTVGFFRPYPSESIALVTVGFFRPCPSVTIALVTVGFFRPCPSVTITPLLQVYSMSWWHSRFF